jgi:integrase
MPRGRALGPGRLFKRGSNWILDYRDASSKRHHLSLGGDRRVAERRQHELINRRNLALEGLGGIAGLDMPLVELADRYVENLAQRSTPAHVENVASRLARTLAKLPGARVRDLRPSDALRLRAEALAAGSSHRTANLVVTTLSAMLRWGVETELVAANPIGAVKKLRESGEHRRYQRRALSDEEIERFLGGVQADDENAARRSPGRVPQEPLFLALLDTGARWSELRRVRWGDVDLRARLLSLRAENTKSRKPRVVPLTDRLVEALRELQATLARVLGRIATATDWVFLTPDGCAWGTPTNNVMRVLDRVLERAGLAKVDGQGRKLDIHALRHSFATRLARRGVALIHAQRLLGHSDPKLTAQVYTHLDVEDLRGAIAAIDAAVPTGSGRAGRTGRSGAEAASPPPNTDRSGRNTAGHAARLVPND